MYDNKMCSIYYRKSWQHGLPPFAKCLWNCDWVMAHWLLDEFFEQIDFYYQGNKSHHSVTFQLRKLMEEHLQNQEVKRIHQRMEAYMSS